MEGIYRRRRTRNTKVIATQPAEREVRVILDNFSTHKAAKKLADVIEVPPHRLYQLLAANAVSLRTPRCGSAGTSPCRPISG